MPRKLADLVIRPKIVASTAVILVAGTSALAVTVAGVPTASAADTGTGTIIASTLNVRPGPVLHELQEPVEYTLSYGTQVTIYCTITSDAVTGPYGTTRIWDMIAPSEGHGDFVSDAWVYTGTNQPVADSCS